VPVHPVASRPARLAAAASIAFLMLIGAPAASAAPFGAPAAASATVGAVELAQKGWIWPASSFRLARPYIAPAHAYGPGHRGVDIRLLGEPDLRAPADGFVAFSGAVAGRGILTIDHGDGLVTTLEPVDSELVPGTPLTRGQPVATLSFGGHSPAGELHFGVRLHGEYINPMLLLGDVPRAVLLPCCG
jgi:murein DD-endopeptidase MepM/ murein hydrolase activator NlpD